MKSPITTHVLDLMTGKPAQGLMIVLACYKGPKDWQILAEGKTNADGRMSDWLSAEEPLEPGVYRMTFETGAYFKSRNIETFYPYVKIVFELKAPVTHYHVPLLLSPYGYSTYRGS